MRKHVQNFYRIDLESRILVVTPVFWNGRFFSFGCYRSYNI